MSKKTCIINVILDGEDIDKVNLEGMAEAIHRVVNGEAVPEAGANEYRSCTGIDIGGKICIGQSK